jgi:hypothetical protein
MLITGNQLKAARALVGVDQAWVAKAANVAINTVRNMESRGGKPITSGAVTVRNVQLALESAGVEFINGGQPGVRMGRKSSLAVPEAAFVAGMEQFESMMRNDVQLDGLSLEHVSPKLAHLSWQGRTIGTASQHNGIAYFDPAVAHEGVHQGNTEYIFADWAGASLRRAKSG